MTARESRSQQRAGNRGLGFRVAYRPYFYVAYLRDQQGNKIALFPSDPTEPGRDD